MSDAPERMWRETIAPNKMYPNGGSFYYEAHKPTTDRVTEYVRVDLASPDQRVMTLKSEIEKLQNLCDCDCNDDDCVRCAHYPAILEQKKDELASIASTTPDPLDDPKVKALVEALEWAEDELASYAPDPSCRSKITDDVLRKVRAALAAMKGGA